MACLDAAQSTKNVLMEHKRYRLLAQGLVFFHLFLRSVATSLEQKVCDGVKGCIRSLARTSPGLAAEVDRRRQTVTSEPQSPWSASPGWWGDNTP